MTAVDAKMEAAHGADHAGSHAAGKSDAVAVAATVGVAVVGAAVLEAAVIPAILIGAAAALAPRFLPKLGERMQPMMDSTVRGTMKMTKKARAKFHEAQERFGDLAAEVDAEDVVTAAAV